MEAWWGCCCCCCLLVLLLLVSSIREACVRPVSGCGFVVQKGEVVVNDDVAIVVLVVEVVVVVVVAVDLATELLVTVSAEAAKGVMPRSRRPGIKGSEEDRVVSHGGNGFDVVEVVVVAAENT